MVSLITLDKSGKSKFVTDDICEMPVISEKISALVDKFSDSHSYVRKAAVGGIVELARHSKLNLSPSSYQQNN
jgi:hypothetical protein